MPTPANPADPQPVDTEAIIRQSIKATQSADETIDEELEPEAVVEPAAAATEVVEPVVEPAAAVAAVETPVVAESGKEKPAAAAAAVVPPVTKKPEDELDITKVPARGAGGKVNTIPQPRVVKMVEKSVEKAKAEWSKTVEQPLKAKVETYETRLHSIASTEDLMFGMRDGKPLPDGESLAAKRTFLQQLANAVPGYAELLKGSNVLGSNAETGVKEAPATKADADDPEPKADVIENGVAVGYSEKGLADLRAWDRRQAARDAVAAAESALVKKYGLDKMSGRFNEVETKRSTLDGINAAIDVAQNWPGFKENAEAILTAMTADKSGERDPRVVLESAYRSVLHAKSTAVPRTEAELEAALRERITAELTNAPRSTSTTSSSVSTRAAEETEQTGDVVGDIIRRSIRGMK
jgi:hypothetical protein